MDNLLYKLLCEILNNLTYKYDNKNSMENLIKNNIFSFSLSRMEIANNNYL